MNKPLLIIGVCSALAFSARAEILINDSFAYNVGSIASQGLWVASGTPGSYPINIVGENLTYAGYQDEASGNAVVVDMSMGKNAVQSIFAPKGSDAVTGTVYYSALVRVDAFPSSLGKPGAIIALTGVNSYTEEYGDALTGSEGGGLYVKKGADDDHALFGISIKSSSNGVAATDVVWSEKEVALDETALVLVAYSRTDAGDEISLWVNPDGADAGDAEVKQSSAEPTLVDIRGIQIAQRSALMSKMPQVTIDEMRVATELSDIFSGSGAPVTVPNITMSSSSVDFGQVYCGVEVKRTVTVFATDLEGDITISDGQSGHVSVSATTIPAAEAMSEQGFELTLTLVAQESRYYSDRFTLSSPGAQDKVLQVDWHPVPSFVASTLRELADEDSHDMTSVYVYTGQATVTFVESYYDLSYERVVNSIFAQDATGGVELRSATGCGYDEIDITGVKVGDNLTNIAGYLIFGDSGLTLIPRKAADWEVVSHDNTVEPIEVTLYDLAMADDGYVYGNQLVSVKHVRFPDEYYLAGDYHGLWNSQKYEIYDGTLDDYEAMAWMWCNRGADYFKTSTAGYFNHKWTLTGIVNNYYPIHISPRSFADFADEGVRDISGIEDVIADGDESVETFDLYGRRSDATAPGIYIMRRSDGTAAKRLVK